MVASGKVVTAGSGESVSWGDVAGKPTTFPPAAHSEPWASLTGVPATFPPAAHSHAIGDTTGLQAALDNSTRILAWNGTAYVVAPNADVYIGPGDPGAVPDGSVWIDTDA